MAGKLKNDLTNQEFNNWIATEYIGKGKYTCKCSKCGALKDIDGYFLKNNKIPKCECETGRTSKGRIDLTGKIFGYWEVLEYSDDRKWKCKCLCGCNIIRDVAGSDLRNGKSTGCGKHSNRKLDDLTGQRFGDWLVIRQGPTGKHGETQWVCQCQCEKKTVKLVTSHSLKSGNSTSCGHNTTGLKDLTNKEFGLWKVLHRSPVQFSNNSTDWVCECQCKNHTIRILPSYILRSGSSKSCGCMTKELRKDTVNKIYGVDYTGQIGTLRSQEQLDAIKSRENLLEFIHKNFTYKPTITELADILDINRSTLRNHIINMSLQDHLELNTQNTSGFERALNCLFPCDNTSDRTVLDGKELDLYYPEKNMAIEFNGNYWHSEIKKDIDYHQNKSIEAAKKGVFIYHIFEYEWMNKNTRNIIKQMLSRYLYGDRLEKIYARNCEIKIIDHAEADEFISQYHLQGKAHADINIGCYYKNNLIGVMTFGKPRFTNLYEYEMVRLCWHPSVAVIGGAHKLFKYFIVKYNPNNIVSYCDMSKFRGDVYTKLGFKLSGISKPNYKWINLDTLDIKTRYQTQKHKLVENGLGTEDQTESDIMHNLGYVKIHDCGNYRFVWNK